MESAAILAEEAIGPFTWKADGEALAFIAGSLALGFRWHGLGRHPRALWIGAIAWGIYAGWEWLVQMRTPEANIRVDLLLI
jgi:hypothetical protein